ncbi:MAG: 16S rRNA processing protein RimM [Desulfuromonadales bacterium]|nr:16S rRNA processing protein RimM [Desulfuromonadales bacterium]NIS40689.1 16S rRNA processing protein RimM [Desulfuromonadales bacterium]
MPNHDDELFQVGVVTGTHGLRGDLKVRPLTEESESLLFAREIFLGREGRDAEEYVPVRATRHKGHVLLRLKGLEQISKVEGLVGSQVFMRLSDLPELPEDEFYWFQMEGARVVDRRCGDIGEVVEVFTTAAHDILEVQGPYGEVLIPVVDEMIVEIDFDERRLQVDLPDGLVAKQNDL